MPPKFTTATHLLLLLLLLWWWWGGGGHVGVRRRPHALTRSHEATPHDPSSTSSRWQAHEAPHGHGSACLHAHT